MKRLLIILTVLMSNLLFCDELAWVNEQIEAIKPPRTGMQDRMLTAIESPFIFLRKNETEKGVKPTTKVHAASSHRYATPQTRRVKNSKALFRLSLIMNNSAMINNNWYKKGDKINGYKITKLGSHSVVLTKNKRQLLLSTKSSSKNLKFNN